jgi:hypothetical protein
MTFQGRRNFKVLPPKMIVLRPSVLIDIEVGNYRPFHAGHPTKELSKGVFSLVRTQTGLFHDISEKVVNSRLLRKSPPKLLSAKFKRALRSLLSKISNRSISAALLKSSADFPPSRFDSQTNIVNVYVNHLRSKIDLPG